MAQGSHGPQRGILGVLAVYQNEFRLKCGTRQEMRAVMVLISGNCCY